MKKTSLLKSIGLTLPMVSVFVVISTEIVRAEAPIVEAEGIELRSRATEASVEGSAGSDFCEVCQRQSQQDKKTQALRDQVAVTLSAGAEISANDFYSTQKLFNVRSQVQLGSGVQKLVKWGASAAVSLGLISEGNAGTLTQYEGFDAASEFRLTLDGDGNISGILIGGGPTGNSLGWKLAGRSSTQSSSFSDVYLPLNVLLVREKIKVQGQLGPKGWNIIEIKEANIDPVHGGRVRLGVIKSALGGQHEIEFEILRDPATKRFFARTLGSKELLKSVTAMGPIVGGTDLSIERQAEFVLNEVEQMSGADSFEAARKAQALARLLIENENKGSIDLIGQESRRGLSSPFRISISSSKK